MFKATFLALLFLLLLTNACTAKKHIVSIPNGNFEQGLERWTIHEKDTMTQITSAASKGQTALFIKDTDAQQGSSAMSEIIPIKPGLYELKCEVFFLSGRGLGIYLNLMDSKQQKLTRADLVGPDGLVYPDWRYAGVQGGIPQVQAKARAADFGAKPDDQVDDAAALQKAVDAVGQAGGGAILLETGVYQLDRPVTVRHDGVVIRGQGQEKTRLIFRYDLPAAGIAFYGLNDKMKNRKKQSHRTPLSAQGAETYSDIRGRYIDS